jgi:regulator of extracellular matrix RemA (YlzA/DUF370 family)
MLIHIGGGNLISEERIIAVLTPDSAPVKRTIADAKANNLLIDATYGKRTKTVFIMDSGHIVLSFSSPETVFKNAGDSGDESIHVTSGGNVSGQE